MGLFFLGQRSLRCESKKMGEKMLFWGVYGTPPHAPAEEMISSALLEGRGEVGGTTRIRG